MMNIHRYNVSSGLKHRNSLKHLKYSRHPLPKLFSLVLYLAGHEASIYEVWRESMLMSLRKMIITSENLLVCTLFSWHFWNMISSKRNLRPSYFHTTLSATPWQQNEWSTQWRQINCDTILQETVAIRREIWNFSEWLLWEIFYMIQVQNLSFKDIILYLIAFLSLTLFNITWCVNFHIW